MWAALYILRLPNYISVNEVNENQLDFLVDQTCKICIKMSMERSRIKEQGLEKKKREGNNSRRNVDEKNKEERKV